MHIDEFIQAEHVYLHFLIEDDSISDKVERYLELYRFTLYLQTCTFAIICIGICKSI